MSSATVRIEADVSAITRAFATMRTQYQSALGAMRSDAKRETAARVAMERAAAQQVGQTQRAAIRAQVQMARQAAREEAHLARQTAREKQRAEAEVVRAANRAQREAVRNEERANRERQRSFRQMLRDKVTEERNAVRESERQERNKTRMLMAEWRMQARAYRDAMREQERANREMHSNIARQVREQRRREAGAGRRGERFGSQAASAGMSAASGVHGQMVDARRQVAETQESLYRALLESGATGADAARLSRSAFTQAHRAGIDPATLLGGIARAQTEFSVLGSANERERMTPAQRTASVEASLRQAMQQGIRGQRLGGDPGEMLRLSGMFRQSGFDPAMIDDLLVRTTSLAQRGAVEASAVTAQSMASIQRRMSQAAEAAGPNATTEQRREAMRQAYVQSFAEAQILRSRGFTPRAGGNAMAAMNQALAGSRTAEAMRTNLETVMQSANRRTPEGQNLRRRMAVLMSETDAGGLFEADPERRGQRRLRAAYRGNALAVSTALANAGLDATTAGNVFAGGGHGNRQALQANWRNLMGAMIATNAEGVSGARATEELMRGNLTGADQARLAQGAEESPMAAYIRQEGARLDALTQNTGAMGRLSQAFEAWAARNPVAATVGGGAASTLAPLAVGAVGSTVARYGLRAVTGIRALLGGGAAAASAAGVGTGGASGAAGTAAAGLGFGAAAAGLAGVAALGGSTTGVLTGQDLAGRNIGTGERVARGVGGALGLGPLIGIVDGIRAAVSSGIREGMTNATVTVDPHTVQQVVSSQPAPNGGRSGGPPR